MQPKPIGGTIGPPRPSFRCFILATIRLSASSRLRNRQAMALQNFSIRRCVGAEIQFSKHATSAAKNLLPRATRKLCRPKPDGRDDEDAHESGAWVRCAAGTQSSLP